MVKDVVEKLTAIPLASVDRVQLLKAQLQESLIGQEEVIDKLIAQLQWIEQGVITQRPLGAVSYTHLLNTVGKAYLYK